jgi:hypothetical protein
MKGFTRVKILSAARLQGLLCSLMIAGCGAPEEPYVYVCKDGPLNVQEVTNLRYFQSTINGEDSLATLVIRTDEKYKKYIVDRVVNIDFSKETLLCGRLRSGLPGHVIKQTVTSSCASNNLVYDVEIKVGRDGIAAITEIPFFVRIPKISDSTRVIFRVHL